MLTTSQKTQWYTWLVDARHISLDVARAAGLKISETRLTIPVRDEFGKVLFNKYRRAPWIEDGPKYMYDKGATSQLFGLDALKKDRPVILTEGELDALALRTIHFNALSTTGGAQAFRPEWAEEVLREFDVTILYDADKAGVLGALRVARMIPTAKIAWLPVQYGKDATEVIASGHTIQLHAAIHNARRYRLPPLDAEPRERIDVFKKIQHDLADERKEILNSPNRTPFFVDIISGYVDVELQKAHAELRRRTWVRQDFGASRVERARSYPIGQLIKINAHGFAKCVYHDEGTASMKCYPDGHCYSYCCGKRSNAIDIYMATHSCDFKTALSALVP